MRLSGIEYTVGELGESLRFEAHFIGEDMSVRQAFSFSSPCRCLSEAVRVRPHIYTLVYMGSPSPTHRLATGGWTMFTYPSTHTLAGGAQ